MVHHVGGIETELETLGFRHLDGLGEISVKAPAARTKDRPQTHRWNRARQSILEKHLAALLVSDSIQSAKRLQSLSDRSALRIFDDLKGPGFPVRTVSRRRSLEGDLAVLAGKRAHNIGSRIAVK